jgi:hypothetical protein
MRIQEHFTRHFLSEPPPQQRFIPANASVGVSNRVEDFAAIYFLRALQELCKVQIMFHEDFSQ